MFQKKYFIPDSAIYAPPLVLITESDDALAAIYHRHLRQASFGVLRSPGHEETVALIKTYQPDLLVFGLEPDPKTALRNLRAVRYAAPGLLIVTVGGGLAEPLIPELLDLGIGAHLHRGLTKPADIALTVSELLHYPTI